MTKVSVRYRHARGSHRCGTCSMFQAPEACTLVAGRILRSDVCDRWEPK